MIIKTRQIKNCFVEYTEDQNTRKVVISKKWHATGELYVVEVVDYPRNQYIISGIINDLNERGYFNGSEFKEAFNL